MIDITWLQQTFHHTRTKFTVSSFTQFIDTHKYENCETWDNRSDKYLSQGLLGYDIMQ
jgi:hypothetical protein